MPYTRTLPLRLAECPRKLQGLLAAAWAADAAKRPGAASMLASLEALESEAAGKGGKVGGGEEFSREGRGKV